MISFARREGAEGEIQCVTAVTDLATSPGNAQTLRMTAAEVPLVGLGGVVVVVVWSPTPCATGATGVGTSPGSVPRRRVVSAQEAGTGVARAACATGATGLAISPVSVLRATLGLWAGRSVEADVGEEVSNRGTILVDRSVTSAIDSVTSPGNAERKRIGATSVMVLVTLLGIVVRMKTLATIAMRLDIS